MPTNAFPSTITQVDTAARFPLGYEVTVPAKGAGTTADRGEQVWIYVFNDDAAWAEGIVVMRDATTVTYDGVLSTAAVPAIRLLGVAQHVIAGGSYGFILKRGIGEVQADDTGNDQADDPLVTRGAVGRADVMAAGEEHCVFAFSTENAGASAGDKMTCMINCPG